MGGLPGVRDPGLGEYDIVYLFIDGIAERIRPGQKREPVLAAWGFTATGAKEDAETVGAFFQEMRARGLGDPLLVVSDGAPGIIKAIETCIAHSERQRCLAHRMRNLPAKVPDDVWPEFKARATACYQAPCFCRKATRVHRFWPKRIKIRSNGSTGGNDHSIECRPLY